MPDTEAALRKAQSDFRTAETFLKINPADVSAREFMKEAASRIKKLRESLEKSGKITYGRTAPKTWTGRSASFFGDIPGSNLPSVIVVLAILGLSVYGAVKK